jgi:hypothetical protein
MLIVAGAVSILNSIWAFRYSDTLADLIIFEEDLEVWGIIWLVVGIILILAGIALFSLERWARWVGIVAASIAILSNLSWAQIQPTQSLIGAALAALVVYGLAARFDPV